MTTVALTGIQIGSPLGFMAALGLLRVLHEDHGLDVNLRWQDGHAVLGGIDTHALLALLAAHMRGRQQAPEFNFEVGTGSSKPVPVVHLREIRPEDYRRAAATLADNPRALGFLAGFATDAVVTDKGFIARTAFDFSSARQELGKEFRNLAARLDPDRKRGRKEAPVEALWTHGLFGGPYAEQHSFGWDPATLMGHGQAAIAPTRSEPLAQPGLVWLAVESLPWHPVLPDGNGRARTTGWPNRQAYAWPEWSIPLSAPEVRLLRARPVPSLLQLPGITGLWASQRTNVGKFGFFLPAARTLSTQLTPVRSAQR